MEYKELFIANISDLEFDQKNPRLPKKLQNQSDEKVIEWMLLDASLLDLVASIAINGFFPGEPLLVVKNKFTGKFTVVEGNRRLASCKILNDPSLASIKEKTIYNIISETPKSNIPKSVPAFLFEERKDILQYLGYRHVTGVKSWGALPKAKYLYELFQLDTSTKNLREKSKELAKKIGSRGDYVMRLLTSYQLFLTLEENNFFNIDKLSEENIEFSNLVDSATRFSNISNYLNLNFDSNNPLEELNINRFEELCKWLFARNEENKTQIGENRNIRILNSVIKNEKALEAFRAFTPIKEANLLTEAPDQIYEKSLKSALNNLKNAKDVVEHIKGLTKDKSKENLSSIQTLVNELTSQDN